MASFSGSVTVKDERAKRVRTSGGSSSNPRSGAAEDEAEVTRVESLDERLSRQQGEAEAAGELVDVTQASASTSATVEQSAASGASPDEDGDASRSKATLSFCGVVEGPHAKEGIGAVIEHGPGRFSYARPKPPAHICDL